MLLMLLDRLKPAQGKAYRANMTTNSLFLTTLIFVDFIKT